MKLFTGLTAICLWALTSALQQEQFVLHDEEPKPLNVAIIGAFCIETRGFGDHH